MTAETRLFAYLDGALPPVEAATFEAEMANEPSLAARVDAHRQMAARVSAAYAPVLRDPIPPHLLGLAAAANDAVALRTASPWRWTPLAACLVLGVLVGRLAWPQPGAFAERDGLQVAQGALARALTGQLAAQNGVVKVGLTFKARDGRWCRTFQFPSEALAGLTCRRDGRWVAEVVATIHPEGNPVYRTAASQTPAAVLATVDALIAEPPTDANAERAARDRGWAP